MISTEIIAPVKIPQVKWFPGGFICSVPGIILAIGPIKWIEVLLCNFSHWPIPKMISVLQVLGHVTWWNFRPLRNETIIFANFKDNREKGSDSTYNGRILDHGYIIIRASCACKVSFSKIIKLYKLVLPRAKLFFFYQKCGLLVQQLACGNTYMCQQTGPSLVQVITRCCSAPWLYLKQYSALSIDRGHLSPYNSRQIPHSSPVKARYGVSFMSANIALCALSYRMYLRYIESLQHWVLDNCKPTSVKVNPAMDISF